MISRKRQTVNELTISERNSRLLLIITSIGIVLFLFKLLSMVLEEVYQKLYITKVFPFGLGLGPEHIILPMLLSSTLIIIFFGIKYCYSEYINFANINIKSIRTDYQNKADTNYKQMLGILQLLFLLSVSITTLTILFFQSYKLFVLITILLLFTIVIRNKDVRSWYKRNKSIYFPTKDSLLFESLAFWFGLSCLFFILGFSFIDTHLKPSVEIRFNTVKKEVPMQIKFANQLPDKITLLILNKNSKKTITLKENDFLDSFVESTEPIEKAEKVDISTKTDIKLIFNQSYYDYITTKEIGNFLKDGTNYIVINFKSNPYSLINEKNYRIVNRIDIKNGIRTFAKDKFAFQLQ